MGPVTVRDVADRVDRADAPRRQRLVGADRLAPRPAGAEAQLQFVHRRCQPAKERLIAHAPRHRGGGEGRPLVVRRELGRAVGPDRSSHQVLPGEAVVETAEEREEARPRRARAPGHRLGQVQPLVAELVAGEAHALLAVRAGARLLGRESAEQREVVRPAQRPVQRHRVLGQPGRLIVVVDVRLPRAQGGAQQPRRVLLLEHVARGIRQTASQSESRNQIVLAEQAADQVVRGGLVAQQIDDSNRVVHRLTGKQRAAEVAGRVVYRDRGREAQGLRRDGAAPRAVARVDPILVCHRAAVARTSPQAEPRSQILVQVEAQ